MYCIKVKTILFSLVLNGQCHEKSLAIDHISFQIGLQIACLTGEKYTANQQ